CRPGRVRQLLRRASPRARLPGPGSGHRLPARHTRRPDALAAGTVARLRPPRRGWPMIYLDRRLVDPHPDEVADAIEAGADAAARAGAGNWPSPPGPRANLPAAFFGALNRDAGCFLWQPLGHGYRAFLRLAWAVDHRGCRLVRVTAGADRHDDREYSINSP